MVDGRLKFIEEISFANKEIERQLFMRFVDDVDKRTSLKALTVTNNHLFDELSAGMTTWMPWELPIEAVIDM